MKQLKTILAATVVCAAAFVSHADYLWTWHGDSNVFQASFEVTGDELQPGAVFNSPLFLSSMAVTNPLGQIYQATDANSGGSGSYVPWVLGYQINDFQRNTEVLIHSGDYEGSTHRTSTETQEQTFSGVGVFSERGYWSFTQIPEPSVSALLTVGGIALVTKRRQPGSVHRL